ncbi:hypothetical protein DICVIV_01718 [Dictyocaulus viviparus]|uniref:Uncharacterized protein n=1 Tax=Dictyocaulus viviparus TaxID=29172 RepID=A0A0D8Y7F4_DICVI|nr:hypothetical protein DICVIV_01718 [Dictyocaulus viviparus]
MVISADVSVKKKAVPLIDKCAPKRKKKKREEQQGQLFPEFFSVIMDEEGGMRERTKCYLEKGQRSQKIIDTGQKK